jgi:energy-coupling factor transporter ATP-binding protein EcfA2
MLKTLRLRNFRAFADHTVPLKKLTLLVGENNAGKSTVVEALRLIAIITHRYRRLSYKQVPAWLEIPLIEVGVSPALKYSGIHFDSMFHHYGDPPAVIDGVFADGCRIQVYIVDESRIHAVIRTRDNEIISSRKQANGINIPLINIMPQAGPVQRSEGFLSPEYVRNAMSSSLAPLHFRNQLKVHYDLFEAFQQAVTETWPQVQVKELIGMRQVDKTLVLNVRNEGFVGEIATMGHGLQMWLQTMWFLTRAGHSHTIILDEPDVYMHPDLQRRLIRYLRGRYPQVIVTTHSVEIMSEAQPDEMVVVRKSQAASIAAETIPVVKQLAHRVGSVQNIHLARLWRSTAFLHIESKDLTLLKYLQNILFPDSRAPIDAIPNMSIGGWEGWDYAVGTSAGLKNSLDEHIISYCIMDADYHGPQEISLRMADAEQRGIQLHVWQRKEIENYLLQPEAIHRVISKLSHHDSLPSPQDIKAKINIIADDMGDYVADGMSAELRRIDKRRTVASAGREARSLISEKCERLGGMAALASGKILISKLSEWSRTEFNTGFGPHTIAAEMKVEDVTDEVREVVTAIERGTTLSVSKT